MKATDLNLNELLELDPKGGPIHFGGHRSLLFDASAMGALRSELIAAVGFAAAKGILLRFGFAHGWATADRLKDAFPWDNEREWRRAGGRLHALQGLVVMQPLAPWTGIDPEPFAYSVWTDSYEAAEHLRHFGAAQEPVCWTLAGFASGYLSRCTGEDYVFIEDRCVGMGDTTCHVVGRPRAEWGDKAPAELSGQGRVCLDASLQKMVEELKTTERKLRRKKNALARTEATGDDPSGIVAHAESMRQVLALGRRVAKVDSTVLITGESGVGKERLARLVHDESMRSHGPFVAVNCAAVTESLLESELFGHARGAFTGASGDRAGLFEAAQGGTLFLDEVGEIPLSMQAKLLRVLQEREVRRVGENRSRPVDVRIVAATNVELADAVKDGRFRTDLLYRLKVVELRIPALRERKDDVLPLARVLLQRAAERLNRNVVSMTPEAADLLVQYEWPGNVRELENTMERAVVLAEGERIVAADLPMELRAKTPSLFEPGRPRTLDDVERDYILASLDANNGHQGKTAAQLGIGTATLYRKLKAWGRTQSRETLQ